MHGPLWTRGLRDIRICPHQSFCDRGCFVALSRDLAEPFSAMLGFMSYPAMFLPRDALESVAWTIELVPAARSVYPMSGLWASA